MTGENGYPETPEWHCEPRHCPLPNIAALSGTMPPTVGIATPPLEPHIIRGDN